MQRLAINSSVHRDRSDNAWTSANRQRWRLQRTVNELTFSHGSMQSLWKKCLQRRCLSLSPPMYSLRHTAHFSSASMLVHDLL